MYLLQLGEKDHVVRAARNFLRLVPLIEATLFAFRFWTPFRALLLVAAIALTRSSIGVGLRLSILLRTETADLHSRTLSQFIMAERTARRIVVGPLKALLTTTLLGAGLLRMHSPRPATETCVLFLGISELVSYVLRENILRDNESRLASTAAFCLAQTIYCLPLILLKQAFFTPR
ncbi:MAG: hypothetical protein ACRYFU_20855 [Janthinobacterium lividum]